MRHGLRELQDIQKGDVIECFEIEEVVARLLAVAGRASSHAEERSRMGAEPAPAAGRRGAAPRLGRDPWRAASCAIPRCPAPGDGDRGARQPGSARAHRLRHAVRAAAMPPPHGPALNRAAGYFRKALGAIPGAPRRAHDPLRARPRLRPGGSDRGAAARARRRPRPAPRPRTSRRAPKGTTTPGKAKPMAGKRRGLKVDGWLILDKPVGMTSTRAVARVRRVFQAAKAGHGGTLDPLATGVLPIALGEATKTVPYVMDGDEDLSLHAALGRGAGDRRCRGRGQRHQRPCGRKTGRSGPRSRPFAARIQQRPPIYSAIKVAGAARL